MPDIQELHRTAMEFAEAAAAARLHGEPTDSFIRKAYQSEKAAAELCARKLAHEPTRSVLLRSAATLALQCGENREAEQLIATALSGDREEAIAGELRDVLEQVDFNRHLETR